MKTFWFQILGLIIVIMVGTFLTFNKNFLLPFTGLFNNQPKETTSNQTDTLRIVGSDGNTKAELSIEIADEGSKRSKGLGYRQNLATGSGMLFIHESSQKYNYWMKGMQFPIDIMWVKGEEIVDIIPDIPPPIAGQGDDTLERYAPTTEVDKVLETNAGFVTSKNIQRGDKIVVQKAN